MVHDSASPPTIPDGRLSRVRFWPRLCTPFSGRQVFPRAVMLKCLLTYTSPARSCPASSSRLPTLSTFRLSVRRLLESSRPPSAQSPFAWHGRYPLPGRPQGTPQRALPLRPRSYGLMRQTTILPTPRWFLGRRVFAACRKSLLDDGPSRHYLCHLCVGAWTHTPPGSSDACAHPFSDDSGLTSRETRSAPRRIPARRFPQGALFRGCSHSLLFRPPHSLDRQIVPTAVA
jgi:hypothetical protein